MLERISVTLSPIDDKPHILAYVDFAVGPVLIRGTKVINDGAGQVRVIFPEEPVTRQCPGCYSFVPYNHLYCNYCGSGLSPARVGYTRTGTPKRHRSIVQPLDGDARHVLTQIILRAYRDEYRRRTPRVFQPLSA